MILYKYAVIPTLVSKTGTSNLKKSSYNIIFYSGTLSPSLELLLTLPLPCAECGLLKCKQDIITICLLTIHRIPIYYMYTYNAPSYCDRFAFEYLPRVTYSFPRDNLSARGAS